ncbi:MAG: DUF502 domain-containing protein [Fidelibacterota bacterium]
MAGLFRRIRGKIVAGLVTIIPIAATVYIIRFLFNLFDNFPFLDKILPVRIPGLGVIVSLVVLFLLGVLVTNFLGRKLIQWGEWILRKIPVASTVYETTKQITQAMGGSTTRAFQKGVWIEYPRRGVWTLAFVTGESTGVGGGEYYHLFVPTTPNPTSGFMLVIPKTDTIDSKMSVEGALKAIISGGMLAPGENMIGSRGK